MVACADDAYLSLVLCSSGKTWQAVTHGPFWMAANNGMTTSSGVLIFGGRYPDIGLQISYGR